MRRCALGLVTFLAASPTFANDSTAELGTGGLILSRSDVISMEKEDLFISPQRVTVDYVFQNRSDKDVDTIVAFPMPDIEANPYGMISVPDLEKDNFLGFEVTVDGKSLEPQLEHRAFAAGIDISEVLKAQGVPLFPFSEEARKALEKLPADVAADWLTRGIITVEEYDDGSGWKRVNSPFWMLKSTYWWRMTFPAGREVKVAHRYRPSLGGTAGLTFFMDGKLQGDSYQEYKQKYCMDEGFERAVLKAAKANPDGYPQMTEGRLSYVLKTGGNWALGTIGKFSLTVDKGNPKSLVSFCGKGVEKTGPTTFRMTADDYYPARDIDILILTPYEMGGGTAGGGDDMQPTGQGG